MWSTCMCGPDCACVIDVECYWEKEGASRLNELFNRIHINQIKCKEGNFNDPILTTYHHKSVQKC